VYDAQTMKVVAGCDGSLLRGGEKSSSALIASYVISRRQNSALSLFFENGDLAILSLLHLSLLFYYPAALMRAIRLTTRR
jgi:hypothetical protein